MIFSTKPNRTETILGSFYLFFDVFVLPLALGLVNSRLPEPLGSARINFLYFLINFAVILPIFRKFLLQSLKDTRKVLFSTLRFALLGYVGYRVLSDLLLSLILRIYPPFYNFNDLNVALTLKDDFALMAVGTVLLVPIAEETLFRGLIFRGLYDRSPLAAYLVSMVSFAAVHVIGYVGIADAPILFLSFLQYLPAGYCLCFAYRRSCTIASPILIHMLVNAVAAYSMR